MRTLLIIVAICICGALKANPQLTYSVSGSGNYYPYYTHDPKHPGILPEIVSTILTKASITGENLLLPAKRTVLYLEQGKIDFDLISPSWLNEQQRKDTRFVYSDAILSVDEYLVSTHQFDKPITLNSKEVGTVRGYYYHDDSDFKRIDFNSEKELLQALHRGRIELAIIGDLPAIYWSQKLGVPIFFNTLHSQGNMHMRMQAKHRALLTRINKAINELHQQGQFQKIIQHYVQSIPITGAQPN
ncbi:transporter substrate-binding domain-containing protein [Pseudoalteromonas sp. JBTF-M23]|uniref:Transporter substrate-binding domain-containing protein n=1 Tax=Pseudoalteromonas caenipelagi TaxID=2726988 RepID=A0A849VG76_9GAMM|nr:transporter substrate-binding domain-containing protein [Pseudoalteromonas caenipelagi]NOU52729.1 transporter substrate-binding domain-containing protein [Pseudoalteromonas caenipelagi]